MSVALRIYLGAVFIHRYVLSVFEDLSIDLGRLYGIAHYVLAGRTLYFLCEPGKKLSLFHMIYDIQIKEVDGTVFLKCWSYLQICIKEIFYLGIPSLNGRLAACKDYLLIVHPAHEIEIYSRFIYTELYAFKFKIGKYLILCYLLMISSLTGPVETMEICTPISFSMNST